MRNKTTAAIVTIALVGVVAFSVIGQEDPLPPVTQKASPDLTAIPLAEPTIVLAAEPIREYRPPTLFEAARHNDFITFDALYAAAKKRGEDVSQFDALHELWTYSVTDPIGAFYGLELYERLSRAYPGYATYIEDFRVVDSRGNVFYPTSETRAFLLDRAVEGRPSPRVLVAETKPAPVRTTAKRTVVAPAPSPEPVRVIEKTAPPVVAPEPIVVAETPAAAPAPAVAEPVVIAAKETAPAPAPVPVAATVPNKTASRGILLMIIGLIGVGLLALILRTPREEPLTILHHPPVNPPVNNVEPLRKPQATAADEPRATGSHG